MKEAIECYNRALEIDPYDVGTWLNKAVALQRIGRIEEALECYERILKIDPYHPVALRNKELISMLNRALRSRQKAYIPPVLGIGDVLGRRR